MKKFVLILILIFALFRIFLSIKLQLHPDETYYWLWSQHLDWSYFDHPPMVAYFIKVTTIFFNNEFFVRVSSILTFVLGMFFIWKVVKKMFNNNDLAYMSLFIFNLFPMLGASFIITPDIPLIFFWILSLYCIWLAIREDKMRYWVLSGVCVGFSMLSKYNGIILLISLFVFLILSKNYRKFLLTIKPYLTMIISIIIFLPVIIWNYKYNWISFKFQFFHRFSSGLGNFNNVVLYFLGQIASMGVLLGIISIIVPYIYIFCKSDEKKFLAIVSLVPLTIFAITSYKTLSEMNWPVCAYPSVAILTAIFFIEKKSKFKDIYLIFSATFSIFLILLLYLQAGFGILPLKKFNKTLVMTDPTNWFYGWKEFAIFLDTQEIEQPIVSTTLQLVSELKYYSKKLNKIFYNEKQYSIWNKKEIFPEKGLCINYESDVKTPEPNSEIYSKIKLIKNFSATRNNNTIRIYHMYECEK